jgi:hypothetical protein
MKTLTRTALALALIAGLSRIPARAADAASETDEAPAATSPAPLDTEAPAKLNAKSARYAAAEKDLDAAGQEAAGEEAVIETSHPYLLPRLFTLPTAYSLQSYELRFGGQGNIHSTIANMNTQGIKASASLGLGGIMELGYQLDEYYTVQDISDKILMGYFKLGLLKESKYLPAASISASKNLRSSFHTGDSLSYDMDEDLYEVVFSKAFRIGDNMVTFHPGVQIINDKVNSIEGRAALKDPYTNTKFNPRLGVSWQTRPKTLFMYELKMLHPTDVAALETGDIRTDVAVENNLGIRYYLRNWLCIDSGIRHYYDLDKKTDEMKLHANFVGVIPLATVYDRISNHFKK